MKKTLIFKKSREIGDLVSDTFAFIRLEGQTLIKYIIRFAGIPLALVLITATIYAHYTLQEIDSIPQDNYNLINLFVLIGSALVYMALYYCIVLHYIQSYINKQGKVQEVDIRAGIKKNFWRMVGLILLTGVILGVVTFVSAFITGIFGFLAGNFFWLVFIFFFVPIIYFMVVFSITYAASVFEGVSNSVAINKSFKLIRNEWWATFLTLLLIGLIYFALVMAFQVPFYIYFFANEFVSPQEYIYYEEAQIDWIALVLNAIGLVAQYLLFGIPVITTAFIYYNLNERKNFTGTIESIDKIGERES